MIADESSGKVYRLDQLVTTGTFETLYKKAHKKAVSRQYVNTMCHAGRLPHIVIDKIHFIVLGENGEVPIIGPRVKKIWPSGEDRKPRSAPAKKKKPAKKGKFKAIL